MRSNSHKEIASQQFLSHLQFILKSKLVHIFKKIVQHHKQFCSFNKNKKNINSDERLSGVFNVPFMDFFFIILFSI